MVTAVTSLGRSGLSDWLIQRFTAIVLAVYTFLIAGLLLLNPDITYSEWSAFFDLLWVRALSLIVLVSIVAHGWIGLWGVITDYVTDRLMGAKATSVRMIILFLYALVSITFLVWGVEILWGL